MTTLQNRCELYDALISLAATKMGREEVGTAQEKEQRISACVAGTDTNPQSFSNASAAARLLSYEVIASIITPSGYMLLDVEGTAAISHLVRAGNEYALEKATGYAARLATKKTGESRAAKGTTAVDSARRHLGIASQSSIEGSFKYGGIIPFATPSLSASDALLVINQYSSYGRDAASFGVDPLTGRQLWSFRNVTSPDGTLYNFGRSRSSPAIDPSGSIYMGSDADEGAYTLPVLLSLYPNGTYRWLAEMGNDNVVIGAASPIVTSGPLGENRVYFVSGDGIAALSEGYSCPGVLNPFRSCSGHGICNCATGICQCSDSCRSGAACEVVNTW